MSDEKTAPEVVGAATTHGDNSSSTNGHPTDEPLVVDRPAGWIYKGFKIGNRELWYASPKVQLFMVSIVCFLCPGMFNALGGLGGGGQVDPSAQQKANATLYAVFAVVGFFAGTFANRLGLRLTLALGGVGYTLYSASFLSYSHNQNEGFVVFAGALTGVSAGLLWTAQGAIMMSYPPEHAKGRYISWFWIIFNMGGVIGSLIPLAQNIHKKAGPVTDGTYIAFIILMFCGLFLSLLLVDADKVIREDGTKVILMKSPTWQTEFQGLWETIKQPWVLYLFPMFFTSNIFYTYQNNGLNATHFNTRARTLNGLLYWLAQIIGAILVGYALDYPKIRRSVRAKIYLVFLFTTTMIIWGGGLAWELKQVSREVAATEEYKDSELIDWSDGRELYIGPMLLYFFYGLFDSLWQAGVYWYMGALSNSGRRATNLAGLYKGVQSAGVAIFWGLDAAKIDYKIIFAITWGLLTVSMIIAVPVLWKIPDTVSIEQDLKFSNETIEDVIVPVVPQEKRASNAGIA
jgi:MFS family permease